MNTNGVQKNGDVLQEDVNEFCVVFRKDALATLENLAKFLDIPYDKLGDVLVKGLHIIEMAKEGKIIIETKKERLEVDVKNL